MKRFCTKCGAELDGGSFCNNCGAPVEAQENVKCTPPERRTVITPQAGMGKYIGALIFPLIYVIILLCPWLRIDIPYVDEVDLHIVELFGEIDDLLKYIDDTTSIFVTAFAVITIILSLLVVYQCVRAVVSAVQKSDDTFSRVFKASLFSALTSVFVIVVILILKAAIKSELKHSGYGFFSSSVSNIISFTGAPVVLLIFAIIGTIAAYILMSNKKTISA